MRLIERESIEFNKNLINNLKESEGRTYTVTVKFAGYIGSEYDYDVYAFSKNDAAGEALDNPGSEAEMGLNVESVDDNGDGTFDVEVSFEGATSETYTVTADDEDEASDLALQEAKNDLEIVAIDGEDFEYEDESDEEESDKEESDEEESDEDADFDEDFTDMDEAEELSQEDVDRIDHLNQVFADFADKVEKAFSGYRGKFDTGKPTSKTKTNVDGEPYIDGFTYVINIGETMFQLKCEYYNSMGNYCELGFEQNGYSRGSEEDTKSFTVEKAETLLKVTKIAWKLLDEFKNTLKTENVEYKEII